MRSGVDGTTASLYASGSFTLHTKLRVENGSGTLINLFGRYSELDIAWPNTQAPAGSLNVRFVRETTAVGDAGSLAPLVFASTFNKLNDGITYSPLLQLGRLVVVDVALTTVGAARPVDGASTWYEIFRGIITEVSWPQWDARTISISCNGLAAVLQHQKSETAYSYAAGTSIEVTAREILDNNGFTSVDLSFPAATGKVLPNTYEPGLQKTVWTQLWDLAQSMGWVVYYRYTGQSTLRLTFFEPARGKTTPDMVVNRWWDFQQLELNEDEIRNVGYIQFFDENGVQTLYGPVEATESLVKYGGSLGIRRPFWIALTEDSPIRSQSEAVQLLTAALIDVADPDAIATVNSYPLVFAEIGTDLYRFTQRGRLFDQNQDYAPFSLRVIIDAKTPQTRMSLRGKPSGGSDWWRSKLIITPREDTPVLVATLDADGADLYLDWFATLPITRVRWLAQANTAPNLAAVRASVNVNTTGIVKVHEYDPNGAHGQVVYVGLVGEDADDNEWTGLIVKPHTYDPSGRPRATLTYLGTGRDGVEKWLATATGAENSIALYLRYYEDGATPPAYARIPSTGYATDPLRHFFSFDHPAHGDPNIIIEAYAEDANGLESDLETKESDSDNQPRATLVIDVDPRDNEAYFTVMAVDSDARSWRVRFAKGAEALPAFSDAATDEVRGTVFGVRTKVSAVCASITALGDPEVLYGAGYAFNVASTVAAVQAAAPRSEVIRDSASPAAVLNAVKSAWLEFEVVNGVRQVRAYWNLESEDGTQSLKVEITQNGSALTTTQVNTPSKDGSVVGYTPASLLSTYVLTLTPYPAINYGGVAGEPVVYTLVSMPPEIKSVWIDLESRVNPPPTGNYVEAMVFWNLETADVGSLKVVTNTVPAGTAITVQVNNPTKDGSVFSGWEWISEMRLTTTVTPYSAANYGGVAGSPVTFTFAPRLSTEITDQDGGQIVGPLALNPDGSLTGTLDASGNFAISLRFTVGTLAVGTLAPGELYGRYEEPE